MLYSSAVEIFCEVVRQGSFIGAANALGISGAAVSKQIKRLETQLNMVLFYRTTRRVVPTESGQKLANILIRNDDELGTVLDQMSAAQERPTGQLRVNVPMSFGELFLRGPIADFARDFPDVVVDVDFDDRRVHLVEDGYDLVVRIGVLEDSGLIARRVGDCPLFLCAAPDLIAQHGAILGPEDISRLPAMIYSLTTDGRSWTFRNEAGDQQSIALRPALYANSAGMMLEACLRGVGVSILPHFSCAEALADGRLVRLLPQLETSPDRGIYVVYPDKRFVPLKVRAFIDSIAAAMGQYDNAA